MQYKKDSLLTRNTYKDNGAHAFARLRRLLHIVANNANNVNPPIMVAMTMPAAAPRLFHTKMSKIGIIMRSNLFFFLPKLTKSIYK